MKQLRITLWVTAVVQIWFGALFALAPGEAAGLLGVPHEPRWVDWIFVMMGARFLGYGLGMVAAARDPERHVIWINTMIGIQLLDWSSTLLALTTGGLGLRNVSSAALLPPLIVGALVWWHPRRLKRMSQTPSSDERQPVGTR